MMTENKKVVEMKEAKTIINVVSFGGSVFADVSTAATSLPPITEGGYTNIVDLFEDDD
jgi:hypothetical protein